MAPIAGRPFLEYLVRQLTRDGFRRIVLLTGHGAEAIERYFGTGGDAQVEITYSHEPEPLGTGGALRLAASRFPDERYLVMNGDSFFDIPLATLAADHRSALGSGARLTLALASSAETARFGTVELDHERFVTRFIEKGTRATDGLINAGIYLMQGEVLDALPADQAISLEREVIPQLVGRGLRGLAFDSGFVDIGVPDAYRALADAPEAILSSVL